MGIHDVITIKRNFNLLRGIAYKYKYLFSISLSAQVVEMSLSKVSPFLSTAPSMYTQSSPKPGTDSVTFYMDFGSNSKRYGRFTMSQISRNGQIYTEPIFQVFRNDNSGLLKSTSNCELETMSLRNSASSRRIFSMENWR